MKLSVALQKIREASPRPTRDRIELICGFEPLHLISFLVAHYLNEDRSSLADQANVEITTGLYGDLVGNVARAATTSQANAAAVVIEWADLDPRLGTRSVGPWSGDRQADIVRDVRLRLTELADALSRLSERVPSVVCPPTLPLLLGGSTPGVQASEFELHLEREVSNFVAEVARHQRIKVLSLNELGAASPLSQRHDPRAELSAGFPYRLPHASALAEQLITLMFPASPMKGLITDLDGTLWGGVVGEVGAAALAWSQGDGAQVHGLYQSQLRQLAELGVLLGVATKNDADAARSGLARDDLQLDASQVFPVCASWEDKRHAIAQCLSTWNVAPDAVVFVDDSQLELDLARAAFPSLTCLHFDARDPAAVLQLLRRLRALFGRSVVTVEDQLRSASIRASATFTAELGQNVDTKHFLRQLDGELTLTHDSHVDSVRCLQLLGKTNQFNLNGERLSEAHWQSYLTGGSHFVLAASYRDKYGSLGNVGVLAGTREQDALRVEHWVLSCRAFSRRLEHHMLSAASELAPALPIRVNFEKTARNAPIQRFLASIGMDLNGAGPFELSPDALRRALDAELPHTVRSSTRSPEQAANLRNDT